MRSVGKKSLSILMSLMIIIGGIVIGLGTTSAEAKSYSVGDIIEYGTYPQSRVTSSSILTQLNSLNLSWVSYDFYVGDGNYGSMTPSSFMRYSDVVYLGNKYRAVTFDSYRPTSTVNSTFVDVDNVTCTQKNNGYEYGRVYWFKYEPIKWRVLDPINGFVFSDLILDTQSFSDYVQKTGSKYYNEYSEYASKYSSSSIRAFLTQTFMNLAFSDRQKTRIKDTTIVTKSAEVVGHGNGTIDSYSEYNDPAYDDVNVRDKVFLMSYYDLKESSYGFDNSIIATDINIDMRGTYGTDYAYCLGLGRGSDGKSSYWLRNSDCNIGYPQGEVPEYGLTGSNVVRGCGGGSLYTAAGVSNSWGVKPAMYLTDLNLYSVSYDANGGSGAPTSHSGDVSYTIKSAIPTRSGYNFLGWAESNSATIATYHAGDTITPTKNTILYAVWSDSTKPVASISCTNNVASSQTVTLSFSDNDGIDGYYWGTNTSYLNNTYTSTSSTNTTKTLNTEGTYYLVVKDKTGNLSDRKSITLYKTMLNANGGSVSPSSVLTASGNSFALPTPIYTDHSFSGWNISSTGSGTNYSGTYTPSSSRTLYAQWTSIPGENIYNLGEETYSFENYGDYDSPDGHCFGMAVTSSGYYTGNLDKSIINLDDNSSLYSLSDSATVRKPICYYLHIQGTAANSAEIKAIVAGGSIDLRREVSISKDWNECINYVKSNKHDNKGVLNIGMYFLYGGGHAVNFLYYKNVGGQDRIYAYDNNYPETETYYYMGSDGYVHQGPIDKFGPIRGIDLMDINTYFVYAPTFDASKYIYANKNEIVIEGAEYCYMKCSGDFSDYVMYEIPDDVSEVTVTPLADNAKFTYCNNTCAFGAIDEDTYGKLSVISEDEVGKTAIDSGSVEVKFNIENAPSSVSIKNFVSSRSEAYKTTITFTATINDAPASSSVHWIINGKDVGTGDTYTVEKATSTYTVQTRLVGSDNAVLAESEVETVQINNGFFARLIAFFRQLFRSLPVITQSIKEED